MFHIKKIVKPLVNKELTKVLPIALSSQTQIRSYSDHQIPERLQHIPTAVNPKFFDMVRPIASSAEKRNPLIDFFRAGRILLPPRLSDRRGLACGEHEGTYVTRGKATESQRHPAIDAALRSYSRDQLPVASRQRRLRDHPRLPCPALDPSHANQRR